jgi:hypothetical protein
MMSVGRYFGDEALLLQFAERRVTPLRITGEGTCGEGRVEAQAEVIVESIGSRELTVGGLTVSRAGSSTHRFLSR